MRFDNAPFASEGIAADILATRSQFSRLVVVDAHAAAGKATAIRKETAAAWWRSSIRDSGTVLAGDAAVGKRLVTQVGSSKVLLEVIGVTEWDSRYTRH